MQNVLVLTYFWCHFSGYGQNTHRLSFFTLCEHPLFFVFILNLHFNPCTPRLSSKCLMELAVTSSFELSFTFIITVHYCCVHGWFVLMVFRVDVFIFSVAVFLQINSICVQIQNMPFASNTYKYLFLQVQFAFMCGLIKNIL